MKKLALVGLILLLACSDAPQTVTELSKAGEKAIATGDYRQAREFFGQALEKMPSDRDLLYLMGSSYLRERMWDSAHLYLKRVDLLFPNDLEINLALAEASRKSEQWVDARRSLEVLAAGGATSEQLEDLLFVSFQGGEYSFAYYYARQMLPLDSANYERWLLLADLANELDSAEVALGLIDSALERFGQNERLLDGKASYLTAAQKFPSAERIYRNLIALDTSSLEYRLKLVGCLMSQYTRVKSQDAYDIMLALQDRLPPSSALDSTMDQLRKDLGLNSDGK